MAAVAFLVTVAVFAPSARYEFVDYDDRLYVIENEHMREGLTVGNAAWAFASRGYADNWHPLTWISLQADVSALRTWERFTGKPGDEKWGVWDFERGTGDRWFTRLSRVMHFHNVLLHAANAALLFLLAVLFARRAGKEESEELRVKSEEFDGVSLIPHPSSLIPLFLSLLWALHPLRVEAVCWVAERKEVLSCFFMLITLIIYCGAERSPRPTKWWIVSFITYAAAVASKPVAVTLPAVIVAWDWIFRGRIRWARIVPFAAFAFLSCLFTMQSQGAAMDAGSEITTVSRLSMIFVSPLVYIRQTFWPLDLAILYETTTQINLFALLGGIALHILCLSIGVAWVVRRVWSSQSGGRGATRPTEAQGTRHESLFTLHFSLLTFAVAWLYVGLLPMLGIVKVGCQEHCDRYTYWVGCGACVVAAMALGRVADAIRRRLNDKDWGDLCRVSCGCALALVVALACLTWRQMGSWKNTVALYRNAMKQSWVPEAAKILADQLARRDGKEGVKEGLEILRDCATKHPCVTANLNLAAYTLMYRMADPFSAQFGGKLYGEEEFLIREAMSKEPDNERAKKMLELIEARRKEVK